MSLSAVWNCGSHNTGLRLCGYKGDLCVEDESLGKHPKDKQAEVLKRELDSLRDLA